jgi:site-specific DNA-methyltransferase (adenine-specific)
MALSIDEIRKRLDQLHPEDQGLEIGRDELRAVLAQVHGKAMHPYYDRSGVTIYHGDCRELIPALTWDTAFADPPYNVGRKYLGLDDSLPDVDFAAFVASWLPALIAKSKRLAVTGGVANQTVYLSYKPKWTIAWVKPFSVSHSPLGASNWEPVSVWGDGWHGARNDVIRETWIRAADATGHDCPKSLNFMMAIVRRLQGDVLLDPFCGSGTTLVAAKRQGVKAIGIEIEERYCEIAAKRLQQEVLPLEMAR